MTFFTNRVEALRSHEEWVWLWAAFSLGIAAGGSTDAIGRPRLSPDPEGGPAGTSTS